MTEPRRNRQCGLGWHDECTDPFGESCECECHPWLLRNEINYEAAIVRGRLVTGDIPGVNDADYRSIVDAALERTEEP